MKGFLNKVQSRVATNGKPEGMPVSTEGKMARGESTPRADIALPKKEKRWKILLSISFLQFFNFCCLGESRL